MDGQPCKSRLSTAPGRAIPNFGGVYFLNSILRSGEGVLQSPAELPAHLHLFPPLHRVLGFVFFLGGGGWNGVFAFFFFTALFLSCSARLRCPVSAKAKIQNILGKAAQEREGNG